VIVCQRGNFLEFAIHCCTAAGCAHAAAAAAAEEEEEEEEKEEEEEESGILKCPPGREYRLGPMHTRAAVKLMG
jgi:hypothetical protein